VYREILWTEDSEEHIARHGVGSGLVEEVVNGRPVLTLRVVTAAPKSMAPRRTGEH